ncbi:hypothetical protein SAMN04488030_2741 [Aliiroseovarius halocynthiae]|nr:hypothetical protein SAMN04488030_2741 [Aliiroseovarius halocynthiae]
MLPRHYDLTVNGLGGGRAVARRIFAFGEDIYDKKKRAAGVHRSKVDGDALLFPIPKAYGFRAIATAEFGG